MNTKSSFEKANNVVPNEILLFSFRNYLSQIKTLFIIIYVKKAFDISSNWIDVYMSFL